VILDMAIRVRRVEDLGGLKDFFDSGYTPVESLSDGDELTLDLPDASNGTITPQTKSEDLLKLDLSVFDKLVGPFEVRGAEAGDALEVEVVAVEHRGWGWTSVLPGFGLFAGDANAPADMQGPALKIWRVRDGAAEARFGELDVSVPISPFLGVLGTAPPTRRLTVIPPRENGGNMDYRCLTSGSRVFLPCYVRGGMLFVGLDGHLAQGQGEICGTAIEAPVRATLRVRLRRGLHLSSPAFIVEPQTKSAKHYVFSGIDVDPLKAIKKSVLAAVDPLSRYMSPVEAYMLLSVVADVGFSELVDMPNYLATTAVPKDPLKVELLPP